MQETNEIRRACKILDIVITSDQNSEGEYDEPIRITSPSDDREFANQNEFETYLAELLKPNVLDWTPDNDIENLLEALELISSLDADTYDTLDITNLNSAPFPEKFSGYPVWAVDCKGQALVGSTARQIENIDDVKAFYDGMTE
jgi:predicted house-cleaning noncanonical NTP pyrophosphatase (MazG superfamily)